MDKNFHIHDDRKSFLFVDMIWLNPQPGNITKIDTIASVSL